MTITDEQRNSSKNGQVIAVNIVELPNPVGSPSFI